VGSTYGFAQVNLLVDEPAQVQTLSQDGRQQETGVRD
jgi:hypothetical protein